MPVTTRRQAKQIASILCDSIATEDTKQTASNLCDSIATATEDAKLNKINKGVIAVLRERWSECQQNALNALERVRQLETNINNLELEKIFCINRDRETAKQLLEAQAKNVTHRAEIAQWEQSYVKLEEKYEDLYEKYQEMAMAAGSEINGLEKTCENQAFLQLRVESERDVLKKTVESFKENEVIRKELKTVVEVALKPIETMRLSINTDAVSRMGKALLNIVGVQYKSLTRFKEENLESSVQNDDREVPHEFLCPISGTIMDDPIMASNGEIFNRDSIIQWQHTPQSLIESDESMNRDCVERFKSPLSRETITNVFHPHAGLKRQIREWTNESANKERQQLYTVLLNLKQAGIEAKSLLDTQS